MKLKKEQVLEFITEYSSDLIHDEFPKITTRFLSEKLKMQRTNISSILNQLVNEGKLVKYNGRPVLYQLADENTSGNGDVFEQLVGYDSSLKEAIASAKAAVLYPLDDWQVYQMEALIAMKRSKEAVALYHKTEEMLLAEIGSEPSKSMLEQLKRISSCVTEDDATHIQAIQEKLEEEREEGAFYCSYPVFIENYRFAKRVLQRTGKSAWLLMSTITDGKGYASEGGVHFEYIRAELEQALKNSLRSGDLYTRYSINQYLILLIGIEEENCGLVIERINDNMERTAGKKYVKYHKVLVNGTDE